MSRGDLTGREVERIAKGICGPCGGNIEPIILDGKALDKYLDYRYRGGDGCARCYSVYEGTLPPTERKLNLEIWLRGQ